MSLGTTESGIFGKPAGTPPPDDTERNLSLAYADSKDAVHLGVVGDTYTLLMTGKDTAGQFCLIDMHVPPGGGPPPHRHDFEETFVVLEGEVTLTFRGVAHPAKVGATVNIPANAPHQFRNNSMKPARLLCLCSPAGQENMFLELGVRVDGRTTPPPKPTEEEQKAFAEKAKKLAREYRTEMLEKA